MTTAIHVRETLHRKFPKITTLPSIPKTTTAWVRLISQLVRSQPKETIPILKPAPNLTADALCTSLVSTLRLHLNKPEQLHGLYHNILTFLHALICHEYRVRGYAPPLQPLSYTNIFVESYRPETGDYHIQLAPASNPIEFDHTNPDLHRPHINTLTPINKKQYTIPWKPENAELTKLWLCFHVLHRNGNHLPHTLPSDVTAEPAKHYTYLHQLHARYRANEQSTNHQQAAIVITEIITTWLRAHINADASRQFIELLSILAAVDRAKSHTLYHLPNLTYDHKDNQIYETATQNNQTPTEPETGPAND